MKKTILILLAFTVSVVLYAQNKSDQLTGIWTNNAKNIRVEFLKTSGTYSAKIVWLAEPNGEDGKPKLDTENPNPALRKKTLVGTTIIYNLKFDGKNYVSGKIYAPRRGITADCSIKMMSLDKIEITGKKGFYNDTKTWTRCK